MVPNPSLAVGLPNPVGSLSQVELSRGNNVLYWRTTAFSVWSKVPKPVLVRNIGITGVWGQEGGSRGSRSPLPAKPPPAPRGGLHFRVLPLQARHLRPRRRFNRLPALSRRHFLWQRGHCLPALRP